MHEKSCFHGNHLQQLMIYNLILSNPSKLERLFSDKAVSGTTKSPLERVNLLILCQLSLSPVAPQNLCGVIHALAISGVRVDTQGRLANWGTPDSEVGISRASFRFLWIVSACSSEQSVPILAIPGFTQPCQFGGKQLNSSLLGSGSL